MSFHKQTFHKDTFHQHDIPEEILRQLKVSRYRGFPFFAYTGIKHYLLLGNDELRLINIPKNPNGITLVQIIYDVGKDTYILIFWKKKKFKKGSIESRHKIRLDYPFKKLDDIYVDNLAETIVREMGVT